MLPMNVKHVLSSRSKKKIKRRRKIDMNQNNWRWKTRDASSIHFITFASKKSINSAPLFNFLFLHSRLSRNASLLFHIIRHESLDLLPRLRQLARREFVVERRPHHPPHARLAAARRPGLPLDLRQLVPDDFVQPESLAQPVRQFEQQPRLVSAAALGMVGHGLLQPRFGVSNRFEEMRVRPLQLSTIASRRERAKHKRTWK